MGDGFGVGVGVGSGVGLGFGVGVGGGGGDSGRPVRTPVGGSPARWEPAVCVARERADSATAIFQMRWEVLGIVVGNDIAWRGMGGVCFDRP